MEHLYEANTKIQIHWLEELQRILIKQGHSYKAGDGGHIDNIYKAINAIYQADKVPPSANIPISSHFQVSDQWMSLIQKELFQFNARGDEYLCSTEEALIKCNGLKRALDDFDAPLFFRGEHNFGWDLISKLGRTAEINWDTEDANKVTSIELKLMAEFQQKVEDDTVLKNDIFGDSTILPKTDSGWWSIMQHYDEEHGTRMIDITSSLFCALYFACTNWDGTVDSSIDGKLYLFPYPPGRGQSLSPDTWKDQVVGPEDHVYSSLTDYYKVDSAGDYPRFRKSPVKNDRALSQDGMFIWQPKFTQPLKTFQIFPFRVHRDYKQSILKELTSMGYTKERILSENRFGV